MKLEIEKLTINHLVYLFFIDIALQLMFAIIFKDKNHTPAVTTLLEKPVGEIYFGLFRASLIEEVIFRWAPCLFMIHVLKIKDLDLIFYITIPLSLYFGWLHGNRYEGIFIQGIGGLFYCLLFINIFKNYGSLTAMTTTWAVHFIHNSFAATIVLIAKKMIESMGGKI